MLGINGYELIILVVLALVILGPERLPQYAQTLAEWVRKARGMAEDAKKQFKEETGTDFDDVDWKKYDPRQYDPRRIIREALAEEVDTTRRAVGEVRDAARLEPPRRPRSGASGSRSSGSGGSGAGARGATPGARSTTGSGRDGGAARRAGTAGAAHHQKSADPREVFGAGKDAKSSGALAAGLAGASVAGITGSASLDDGDGAGSADTPPTPAPFDVDAT
ncbi:MULTISPECIES: hypothetical protein [Actinomycetes]|uniref:Sec-independent protein translocase protein TatB n=2 Tax=Actinomycetes TaxID=1760 RepID=A0ABP6LY09_9MICC